MTKGQTYCNLRAQVRSLSNYLRYWCTINDIVQADIVRKLGAINAIPIPLLYLNKVKDYRILKPINLTTLNQLMAVSGSSYDNYLQWVRDGCPKPLTKTEQAIRRREKKRLEAEGVTP